MLFRSNIDPLAVPGLSGIPVIGNILFNLSPYFYVAVLLVALFTYAIFKTRWGLRIRASGEQPSAAGTVGVDVIKLRYRSMILAGALAGFAGSYLALSGTGGFGMGISSGRGFIALAALIFGRFCLGSFLYYLLRGRSDFAIGTLPWKPGAFSGPPSK